MKTISLGLIRFYQKAVSPLTPKSCRYLPTCSTYGYEAISKYGFWKGARLTVWRIMRCHPFAKGGIDPVP